MHRLCYGRPDALVFEIQSMSNIAMAVDVAELFLMMVSHGNVSF